MESGALRFHSTPLGELPPPAPRDCFGRDELIEKVIEYAENLKPTALIGPGGIGKTSVALTVLHHPRIEERFGENRRFIRCDQFPASRAHFLARLSKVIGAGVENPEDLTPLRPFLSSKEMLIILDNAESILDPKGTRAEEIYSVVDELCQFKQASLCITSRITTLPPRCKPLDIPTLSMDAARDIFYDVYNDSGRSNTINDLLKRLDFHALSIKLLATTASHNQWDHDRLAKEWEAQRSRVLQIDFNQSLATTIELSLSSPTFRSLGPNARDLLGAVAFFPQGINEQSIDWLFPAIDDGKNTFDKLCILSLTYRSNGFIMMLAPIQDYLRPQDPRSSPLLCTIRDRYFTRMSVDVYPGKPGYKEAQWILSEDVNVEHLLNVFASIDPTGANIWDACFHFIEHLVWRKPRRTILGPRIEALPYDHPWKPKCLSRLSWLFQQIGNEAERKRHLTLTLELERKRGNQSQVAQTLRDLSDVNRLLGLYKEGIQQAEEAFEIFKRSNDPVGQAQALNFLAWLLSSDKQVDAAEKAASRAIDLVSGKGQEYLVCQLHRGLGSIYQSKGEREKAIHQFQTSLEIATPFNWHDELFWNHYNLADLFRTEDEFDTANVHIEQAKPLAINETYKVARAMYMQALIWYQQDRLKEAKPEALCALETFEKLGSANDVGLCKDLLKFIEELMERAALLTSS